MYLIKIEEARKLYSAAESRQAQIIGKMNSEIEKLASMGEKQGHFPTGLSAYEIEWLSDQLIMVGYHVNSVQQTCAWVYNLG
jgi:hypothetical protein